jgi:hypothetical protein
MSMRFVETQKVVRELLSEADRFSRVEHEGHEDSLAWRLAALRTTLQRLDRRLGGVPPRSGLLGEIDVVYQRILDVAAGARTHDLDHLVANAARLRTQAHLPELPVSLPVPEDAPAPGTKRSARRHFGLALVPFAALGVASLILPLLVPGLRRSRAAWGLTMGAVLASAALGAAMELASRSPLSSGLIDSDASAASHAVA